MQLMLGSASKDDVIQNETLIEAPIIRKLTISEIALNIYLFMVADYETTSTTFAHVSYVLATHPNEQH
ncbi:unnamed protein product [Rotaria sp. Silwood1]|nr:unnamed protein product [Rotaria sp. Silwood1]